MPSKLAKKPANPSKIDYLDLFCGNGIRLRTMAKAKYWREKRLRGVELEKPEHMRGREGRHTLVVGKNLKIHYADAVYWLKKRKDESVKEVNADYLFGGVKSPFEKKGGLDYDYDPNINRQFRLLKMSSILLEIKRVLVNGGFLSLSDYYVNAKTLIARAESLGFTLEGVYWITNKKQVKSSDLQKNLEGMKTIKQAKRDLTKLKARFLKESKSFDSSLKLLNSQERDRQPVRLVFRKSTDV